jgi:fucose 4-O-acetylase-like acetyltransferase
MGRTKEKTSTLRTRAESIAKPAVGTWLLVLVLTVAVALYFKRKTPDAPLDAVSLALTAFFWFVLIFVVQLIRNRFRKEGRMK